MAPSEQSTTGEQRGAQGNPPRVLVVDDNPAIHDDFRKILAPARSRTAAALDELEAELFPAAAARTEPGQAFRLDSAYQGDEALRCVEAARAAGDPYAVIFVDVRMPPGLDGVETTRRVLALDLDVQVTVCSAFADYSWEQMVAVLGQSERWVLLKKPFDPIEVRQLACSMARKWELLRENQRHVEHLEQLVAARTAELSTTNARLSDELARRERAEAELQKASRLEAVGRLAAGMSHEINNPLTYIIASLGFAEDALDGAGAAGLSANALQQLRADLRQAREGAERIGRIVQSLKLFCSGEDETPQLIELRRAAEGALSMLAPELRPRTRVVTRFDAAPPVLAVPSRLQQVFVQLLTNAVQSLPEGGAVEHEILLETREVDGPHGQWAVAEIVDSGVGIPAADLTHVFDPFFTRRPVGRGAGLGLSVCHGIITALGGKIEVESAVGRGTTVRVWLPAARSAAPAASAAQSTARHGRLLIVDDEPLVTQVLQRALAQQHEVAVCHSGREALTLLAEQEFDVILCDLMMGDLTGMDVHAQLRARQPGLEERMIFITGGTYTERSREFVASVRNRVLHKPVELSTLFEALERALARR